jgi:hypothetical protein
VARDREESCNASGHIRIVVNDQHPERMTRRLYDLPRINGSLASRGVHRESHDELAPLSRCRVRLHLPSVHGNQRLYERESDAQSALIWVRDGSA